VAAEPLRESAHRALIKAHFAEGNPGEAAHQYRLFVTSSTKNSESSLRLRSRIWCGEFGC
jgi:hypothetical protein